MPARNTLLLLFTFALVLGFVTLLTTPEPLQGVCLCPESGWEKVTPQDWGFGDNCTEAEDDLRIQTQQVAYDDCGDAMGTCIGTLVVEDCHFDNGQWIADGFLRYECRPTECEPPRP